MKRLCIIGILAIAGGCASVGELMEPKDIPSLVKSYRIEGLEESTGDVATTLDLDECAEYAILSSVGLSGVPSVSGHFPFRELVAREFQKVVVGNFRTVMPEEEPKLEVRIATDRLSIRRSWSRVKAEMVFDVQLVDPEHSRRPYFRKDYYLSAESVQRRKDEVPACVYSCIQNLARNFLEDVSNDSLVIARLKALGED